MDPLGKCTTEHPFEFRTGVESSKDCLRTVVAHLHPFVVDKGADVLQMRIYVKKCSSNLRMPHWS